MTRKFRLLIAVASLLIATYAGGWGSLADEWQSAPTEFFTDSYAPADTPRLLSQVVFDSNVFRPVELPEVFSAVRQARSLVRTGR